MFWKKKDKIIDTSNLNQIEIEPNTSQLGDQSRQFTPGARSFLLVVLVCVGMIGSIFTYKAMQIRHITKSEPIKTVTTIQNTLPKLTPAPPIETTYNSTQSIQSISTQQNPPLDQTVLKNPIIHDDEDKVVRQRRLISALIDNDQQNNIKTTPPLDIITNAQTVSHGELQNKLEPLKLSASKARLLGDRNMLLTQGAMIDCQLETRIVTSQAGMTSCHVTRDIYSTNGRVVLIDRGSKVVGYYQGGLQQGQTRIFVLWSRIETPTGVIINLDSPGTGPLGESGVDGAIDRHFWERFGSAILFSLIGDFGDWAAEQASRGNQTSIQFNNTSQGAQQAVTEILKYSMQISPTLYKNQGDRISIFVARDIDFGEVYALKSH